MVDDRFVVKFAWSEIRARRLWREGMVLERLRAQAPLLVLPELAVLSREQALLVTRRAEGEPLSWEWASSLGDEETREVARELAAFLVRLHGVPPGAVIDDLPVVLPHGTGGHGESAPPLHSTCRRGARAIGAEVV